MEKLNQINQIVKEKNIVYKYSNTPKFVDSKIEIELLDYYYTNPIARASKTMSECRSIKEKLKLNGTRG